MEKKHPKHRKIAKAVISHSVYQKKKAKSKMPHRYDMWEDSVVGGLHIFEWIVIGLVSMVVFGIVALSVKSFAGIGGTGGGTSTVSSMVNLDDVKTDEVKVDDTTKKDASDSKVEEKLVK